MHRLGIFENGARKIFGPKRYKAAGGWRNLQNEGLIICKLYKILG
jgi:hypothetical protein